MEKSAKRMLIAALIASMAMTTSGCVSETQENETEPQDMIETEPPENETEDTSSSETEESEITQPENLITVVDALPYTPEEARLTVSVMGGNPVFYVFEDDMRCYVHNLFDDTVTEYSFGLPDGYTDGKIVHAACGAGSGEVHLYVTAEKNGEYEYLDYYFYCGESPIRLSVGKVNEYNIPIIEEEIAALE